jgi:hypothetical protein
MAKFNVISNGKITEDRELVVSERSDGGFSIAQKITNEVDGQEMEFFVKHAIPVDEDGLEKVKAIIDEACQKVKQNNKEE